MVGVDRGGRDAIDWWFYDLYWLIFVIGVMIFMCWANFDGVFST